MSFSRNTILTLFVSGFFLLMSIILYIFDMKLNDLKASINQTNNQFIGSYFYSSRVEDKLPRALKCNGQTINSIEYPNFVEKYLKTNLVASVSIKEWQKMQKTANNVGYFGYDVNGSFFMAPLISSGTFFSNANVATVNGNVMNVGSFIEDQIVNIVGSTQLRVISNKYGRGDDSGSLSCSNKYDWSSRIKGGNDDDWGRLEQIEFDASKTVRTGDRVMPKTIFYNLYVVVSD